MYCEIIFSRGQAVNQKKEKSINQAVQNKISDGEANELNHEDSPCPMLDESNLQSIVNIIENEDPSDLTYTKFASLSPADKCKLNNRIRQVALRVRGHFPNDHSMFVLVAAHLLRNAHQYFGLSKPSQLQSKILQSKAISDKTKNKIIEDFKEANKKVRGVRTLKYQSRVTEQSAKVDELKQTYGSYRSIADASGIPVKTVYKWCSKPKDKQTKRIELANLRRQEYEQFLMQDSVSFPHPCKKYSGNRYLRHTIAETRKIYLSQPEYHKYGIFSESRMIELKPKTIKLARQTPLAQCLCQGCENCEKIIKSLLGVGIKGIPSNRYCAINEVMCDDRILQSGTEFEFAPIECIDGSCDKCGVNALLEKIYELNADVLDNEITWQRWMPPPGKKVPDIVHVKGTVRQGVEYLGEILKKLKAHIFRSYWNHNIYEYMKKNLQPGQLAQIFDFSMNFRNLRQHEVQPAFWDCTQTAIHVIINMFRCYKQGCSGICTLTTCQITADLNHDSFVTRAAHNRTFKFLGEQGVPMDVVFQFSDNCSSQYKSRRPFVEMARNPLNIIRVYFGERHGKNVCDGFFGRLKAWMSYNIKTENAQITNAYDFYTFCRDNYRPPPQPGVCDHGKVEFQYLTPQDIQRHVDTDLEKSLAGTRSIYSVRNTPDPLKIRNVACLCPPCVEDKGDQCLNYKHTDNWREVTLQPKKRLTKKPDPRVHVPNIHSHNNVVDHSGADTGDVTSTNACPTPDSDCEDEFSDEVIDLTKNRNVVDDGEIYVDLTAKEGEAVEPWADEDDGELLTLTDHDIEQENAAVSAKIKNREPVLPAFEGFDGDIPTEILWESYISALEGCDSYDVLDVMANSMKCTLPPLKPRREVPFKIETEYIDHRASLQIPPDGPKNVHAIHTKGDGNCLSRSLSRTMWGDSSSHLEVRTRIIIEGVVNKKKYLQHENLAYGAKRIPDDESLQEVYAKYSDFYLSGQVMTENAIDYLYSREMYSCATKNSYLGLWQIAQAASVFGVPIRSVYPNIGEMFMRMDFNRTFYPLDSNKLHIQPLQVMWTATKGSYSPNHFVPLMNKIAKYEKIECCYFCLIFYYSIVFT